MNYLTVVGFGGTGLVLLGLATLALEATTGLGTPTVVVGAASIGFGLFFVVIDYVAERWG